jgi:iron complex transport system ATP-binding protein
MSLVVSNLSVALGGKTIVESASFSAPQGKVTGLIGPNGAGKSTLIGAIAGLQRPEQGTLGFGQQDLLALGRRERARLCALVEQSAQTEERLSLAEVVALGRIPHANMFAADSAEDADIVSQALAQVGLEEFAGRQFNTLSGGEQQRGQIARALAQAPQLFLLDEPTSHLDIRAQIEVLTLLRSLATSGKLVLLALHDLNLALQYCDWLIAMEGGKVVAEGTPGDVLSPGLIAQLYGVSAEIFDTGAGAILAFKGIV